MRSKTRAVLMSAAALDTRYDRNSQSVSSNREVKMVRSTKELGINVIRRNAMVASGKTSERGDDVTQLSATSRSARARNLR